MSRQSDRKHAFNLIFQLGFYEQIDAESTILKYYGSLEDSNNTDKSFIETEFKGVIESKKTVDEHIGNAAEGWDISRLSKVDIAIMRLAVYEMMFAEDIPVKVSINEAVELAKVFSTDESPSFINGILGAIASKIGADKVNTQ